MQRHFPVEGVSFVAGERAWQGFAEQSLHAFAPCTLAFIDALSRELMQQATAYPNLAALGFFLRHASVKQQQLRLQLETAQPIGLIFHLTPSNVPTLAVFSWITSLLSGCPSIIRLNSSLSDEQLSLMRLVEQLLQQHPDISQQVRFIQYPHDDGLNRAFSALADARILWGGDDTIRQFAAYPTPTHCLDIKFANRYSLAVIESAELMQLSAQQQEQQFAALAGSIATFEQKACSSPSLLIWLGESDQVAHCRSKLAAALAAAGERFPSAVEQLITAQQIGMKLVDISVFREHDWNFIRVAKPSDVMAVEAGNGNLFELQYQCLDELIPESAYQPQTCVVIGSAEFKQAVSQQIHADRYPNPAQALQHEWNWDGYDLLALQSGCTIG